MFYDTNIEIFDDLKSVRQWKQELEATINQNSTEDEQLTYLAVKKRYIGLTYRYQPTYIGDKIKPLDQILKRCRQLNTERSLHCKNCPNVKWCRSINNDSKVSK